MKASEITVELIAQTAFQLARLPGNQNKSIEALADPALKFLIQCAKVLEDFQIEECTYVEGIRLCTGYKRVRKEQIEHFEEFYEQLAEGANPFALLHPGESSDALKQLVEWKSADAIPIKICVELAPSFRKWHRDRRVTFESVISVAKATPKKK